MLEEPIDIWFVSFTISLLTLVALRTLMDKFLPESTSKRIGEFLGIVWALILLVILPILLFGVYGWQDF